LSAKAVKGTVSRVVDGHTILLTITDDDQVLGVHLAGVALARGSPFSKKARELLEEKLLNRAVEVWVSPDKWDFEKHAKKVTGVVHVGDGLSNDVGLLLLNRGLVRFKRPRPYTASAYTACHYRLAETEAQSKKLGLWQ